jgi:glycosyltransferase involved in cell wall biosynthesis
MRIAQIAPLWIPIPPLTYGGTELIVHMLTEELVRRGHDVSLYASGDSQTSARLIPLWGKSLWRAHLSSPHAVIVRQIGRVLEEGDRFDVLHNHTDFYLVPFTKYLRRPVISTLHRPIDDATLQIFQTYGKWNHFVAISRDQAASAPSLSFVKVIHHGIEIGRYDFNDEPDDYLLWLSKIEPEKGILEAIEVARRGGERLIIAGNVVEEESGRFFRYEVLPHIDGDRIRYVGQATFEKKIELTKNAKAVLYPIKRREPFGLVVVESMACGTPVIAFRQGAMPELIEDGKTGFIVESVNEMLLMLRTIHTIRRRDCRAYVERHFTVKKMVDEYETLYRDLAR